MTRRLFEIRGNKIGGGDPSLMLRMAKKGSFLAVFC